MDDFVNIGMSVFALLISYLVAKKLCALRSFKFLHNRAGRYGSIDGLRGYLALLVVLHHFIITWYWKTTGIWTKPPEHYFQGFGKFGVSIFFMITGFLFISKLKSDNGKTNWTRLFKSRVFRICPLYVFALLIITLLVFINTGFSIEQGALNLAIDYIKWFLYHGSSINGYEDTKKIIAGVDWTLKYEWFFYFSLPFVSLFIRKGIFTSCILFLVCVLLYLVPFQVATINTSYFILFAIGGSCAYLNQERYQKFSDSKIVSLCAITAVVLAIFYAEPYSILHVFLLTLFFSSVVLGNSFFGLFKSTPSIYLGEISYSIYLLHGIVMFILFSQLNLLNISDVSLGYYVLLMPVLASIVVIVSSITYLRIELPFIKLGKGTFKKKVGLRSFGSV
ncbi:TPA: acyltransferase [Vibrio parahaemolyticus]|nr:acyltransferase [Vibrio parahaemolyticus]